MNQVQFLRILLMQTYLIKNRQVLCEIKQVNGQTWLQFHAKYSYKL